MTFQLNYDDTKFFAARGQGLRIAAAGGPPRLRTRTLQRLNTPHAIHKS